MTKIASLFTLALVLLAANVVRAQNFWEPASGPLLPHEINVVAVPSTGIIYCATRDTGVFRSSNNGATWQLMNFGLSALNVSAFAASAAGFAILDCDSGVYVSTDSAQSWQKASVVDSTSKYVGGFLILANSDVLAIEGYHGFYRSTDRGNTWIRDNLGLGGKSVYLAATNLRGEIVAGTDSGLFISKNEGKSWNQADSESWDGWSILAVGPDGRIFTDKYYSVPYDPGLSYSSDDGLTWNEDPDWWFGPTFLTYDPSGRLYAALASYNSNPEDGLYEGNAYTASGSWNRMTWQPEADAMTITPKGSIICAINFGDYWDAPDEFYRSTDEGQTWMHRSYSVPNDSDGWPPEVTSLVTDLFGDIFATTVGGGVLRSKDGLSWTAVKSGWPSNWLGSHSIAVDTHGAVLASSDSGLFKSWNHGSSWTNILSRPVSALAIDSNNVYYAYSSTYFQIYPGYGYHTSFWYRSADSGVTWDSISVSDTAIRTACVSSHGFLFAMNPNALFRSSDGGRSWSSVKNGYFFYQSVLDAPGSLAVDSAGNVFLIESSRLIYSSNDGNTWLPYIDGSSVGISTVALSWQGRVFAGTGGASDYPGIFRSSTFALSVSRQRLKLAQYTSNSPNPFTQFTTIFFTLPAPSYLTLTLFDAAGREVRRIASGYFTVGEHHVSFARGNLHAGVYFYRLETNGSVTTRALVIEE